MWKRLQNVYSQIKQNRLNPLGQPIWQPPTLHPVSYQPPTHRRILAFPVFVFINGEDSFVITSQQFGIHSCLQCTFRRLVNSDFFESIILFSSCSKDSLYPACRSRATILSLYRSIISAPTKVPTTFYDHITGDSKEKNTVLPPVSQTTECVRLTVYGLDQSILLKGIFKSILYKACTYIRIRIPNIRGDGNLDPFDN